MHYINIMYKRFLLNESTPNLCIIYTPFLAVFKNQTFKFVEAGSYLCYRGDVILGTDSNCETFISLAFDWAAAAAVVEQHSSCTATSRRMKRSD